MNIDGFTELVDVKIINITKDELEDICNQCDKVVGDKHKLLIKSGYTLKSSEFVDDNDTYHYQYIYKKSVAVFKDDNERGE